MFEVKSRAIKRDPTKEIHNFKGNLEVKRRSNKRDPSKEIHQKRSIKGDPVTLRDKGREIEIHY